MDTFYDDLAPFYHLLYADWNAAIIEQGNALCALIGSHGVPAGGSVLDAACGVGTQTIGLASKGYKVEASDLSTKAISRLIEEVAKRGLSVRANVDDLRLLATAESCTMDAIVACDNSLPHLLTDADLLDAFQSAWRVLKPGGVAIYSVRDYAKITRVNPDVRPYSLRYSGHDRFMAVQVWEWEGDQYDLRMYLTRESPAGTCSTTVTVTRYLAVTVERLMQLMTQARFERVQRDDAAFFQPIIVGRKPL